MSTFVSPTRSMPPLLLYRKPPRRANIKGGLAKPRSSHGAPIAAVIGALQHAWRTRSLRRAQMLTRSFVMSAERRTSQFPLVSAMTAIGAL